MIALRLYERYFARQIYAVFAFILFAVLSLFIFFDLLNELQDVGAGYTMLIAFAHVALQAPTRIYEMMPVAVLISAIYVCSQMASQSEYTILRVAGLDIRHALWSLIKLGIPLAIATFLVGEFIGPKAEEFAQKVRLQALGATVSSGFRTGVWVKDRATEQDSSGEVTRFVNVGALDADQSMSNVKIYEFDDQYRLRTIRVAATGHYEGNQVWKLAGVTETTFIDLPATPGSNDALAPGFRAEQRELATLPMRSELTPPILSVLLVRPERMSTIDLFQYVRHLRDNKQDTQRYEIAFWKKLIYPFTIFVMMALALPFAYLHARAGAVGIKVFGGIMLGLSFHLVNTLFSHVGLINTWPPIISALLPGALYLFLALGTLRWVDRH